MGKRYSNTEYPIALPDYVKKLSKTSYYFTFSLRHSAQYGIRYRCPTEDSRFNLDSSVDRFESNANTVNIRSLGREEFAEWIKTLQQYQIPIALPDYVKKLSRSRLLLRFFTTSFSTIWHPVSMFY
jgi:hypothetical protein